MSTSFSSKLLPQSSCIQRMREVSILSVAKALGLQHTSARGASAGATSCPACLAERRHTRRGDRRLAAGIHPSGLGWRCFQCDASGDALHFVSFYQCGRRFDELSPLQRDEVRSVCEDILGLARTSSVQLPTPTLSIVSEYPPIDDVLALWESCAPVNSDVGVAAYLGSRGIDADRVAAEDMARFLPAKVDLPRWAGTRRSWIEADMRLIVPLYSSTGRVRSVLARLCREPRDPSELKSVSPTGHARQGLVMANKRGLYMLEHGELPAVGQGMERRILLIVEGEPDLLTLTAVSEFETRTEFSALGVVAGSFTAEIAARIPSGTEVACCVHHDEAGERYAEKIKQLVARRCKFVRASW